MTFNHFLQTIASAAVVLVLLSAPSVTYAAEVRSGASADVAVGETVNEDLFATGQTATIAGRVTGDAYAAAQSVVVTGTVDGDLIATAEQVTVDGTVTGDVRAAGAVVTVNGTVRGSVTGLAQRVNVPSGGRVDGSVVAAAETVSLFGPIGRGVTVGANTLQLAGTVGGNVLAAVDTLTLGPNARIAGNLDYHSGQEAVVPTGAVAGTVQFTQTDDRPSRPGPVLNGLFDLSGLVGLVGSAILGGVAIMFMPRSAARAVERGRQQPLHTFGMGLLALFAIPLAAVIIGVTLIGIPLALTVLVLYIVGLLLGWPALGLLVGTEIMLRVRRDQPLSILGALVVGMIVLHLVTHVPVIGGLLAFVGLAFGLGMLVQSARVLARDPVRSTL